MFVGQKRYLQSSDNLYLCRNKTKGQAVELVWDRPAPKEWETWEIEQVAPNVYAFKSFVDGCYITIEKDGTAVATSKTVTPEARFRIEEISSGSYIITGHNGNIFQPMPSRRVTCDSAAFRPSSIVRIHPFFQVDGGLRSFFCPAHKTWISSEKSLNLICDRPKPAQWETFTIEKHGSKFAFRTYHGRYVTLPKEAEVLKADATTVGPNELFEVKLKEVHDPTEATVLIYAPNGKLLTPMKDGKAVKATTDKVGQWEPIKIVVAAAHK